ASPAAQRLTELHRQGLSDERIAIEMGLSPATIGQYRWQIGLKRNRQPTFRQRLLKAISAGTTRNIDLAERFGKRPNVIAVHKHHLRKAGLLPELRAA
ncbi:MAG TPA: hypothetical protein VNH17_19985, partial [Streptosporangiaceae bacterium]|nr:hypothetical protein [Streptosporangiaceae bacterium]